ncbi:hypothetical protein H1R20_g13917, partial [Candolleomyces eurysporus]
MSPMSLPPGVETEPGASSVIVRPGPDENDDDKSSLATSSEYPSEILLSPSRVFRSARAMDHEGRHTPPADLFESDAYDGEEPDRMQSSTKRSDPIPTGSRHRAAQRHTSNRSGLPSSSKGRGHRQRTKEPKTRGHRTRNQDDQDMKLDRKIQELRQFLVEADETRSAESRALMQELANAKEQLEETRHLAHWRGPTTAI